MAELFPNIPASSGGATSATSAAFKYLGKTFQILREALTGSSMVNFLPQMGEETQGSMMRKNSHN